MFASGYPTPEMMERIGKDIEERARLIAECSPHEWEFREGMWSREWAWTCRKCGKYHDGIERPPAA